MMLNKRVAIYAGTFDPMTRGMKTSSGGLPICLIM